MVFSCSQEFQKNNTVLISAYFNRVDQSESSISFRIWFCKFFAVAGLNCGRNLEDGRRDLRRGHQEIRNEE